MGMGIGDWGLGIGDWGLGIGPNPQSPIPNPQSPIPIKNLYIYRMILNRLNKLKLLNILYTEKKFLFIITKLFF